MKRIIIPPYGKAGCFRLQPYGFEYRTLSSYWIATEARLRFIWRQVEWALRNFERGSYLPDWEYVVKQLFPACGLKYSHYQVNPKTKDKVLFSLENLIDKYYQNTR